MAIVTNLDSLIDTAVTVNVNVIAAQNAVITSGEQAVIATEQAAIATAKAVLTAADVIVTNADATQTALDKIATNADVVLTHADVVTTNADVVLTNADAVSTNADASASAISAAAALVSEQNAAISESNVTASAAQIQTNKDDIEAMLLGSDTLLDSFAEVQAELGNKINTSEIGVSVQGYDANIVSDASYVHTDNNYVNADKAKVDFITVTDNVSLDELQADHLALNARFADTNEPTGFIREFPLTMGVIELSPDGTKIISVDWNGVTTIRNNGLFYDGSTASARQFAIHPVKIADGGDGSYYVYVEGTKHQISVTQKVTFDNTTGLKFVYHDLDGSLDVANQFNFDYFEDRPITCTVYGNAVNQELVNFGDERHGIQMDGFTHRYLHFTQGTQYISGMEIQGLVSGGTTYTQVTSGFAYDEDIYMNPPQQTNAPHLWIDGTAWRVVNDTNVVGHLVTGVAQYNKNTAGVYSLAPVTGNDAMIVFFVLTNNREFPYVKILGQKVYNDTNAARADMENALSDLTLAGLPSPEFLPIGAVIIRSTGAIQTLSGGSLYYDLRKVKSIGSGSISGTSQYHADLLGRDAVDAHPTSAVTGLDTALGLLAPKLSPAFTGTPLAPTATIGTNTTQLATTAFVESAKQAATAVPVTPNGNLSSTDVQSALEELQNDINTINEGVW